MKERIAVLVVCTGNMRVSTAILSPFKDLRQGWTLRGTI